MESWKSVWNQKEPLDQVNIGKMEDLPETFMRLKERMGISALGDYSSPEYTDYIEQFNQNIAEMSFSVEKGYRPSSYFDVGCGTGAYLYYLSRIVDNVTLGGVDYSAPLINVALEALPNAQELYCGEAKNINTETKYDCVYSRSIFQYFDNLDYAEIVIKRMLNKANHSVGIFDIHDENRKEDFLNYRRQTIEDYDNKYKDTQHLFYDKAFFIKIAESFGCGIKFSKSSLRNYWNDRYTYDVYFFKNKANNA